MKTILKIFLIIIIQKSIVDRWLCYLFIVNYVQYPQLIKSMIKFSLIVTSHNIIITCVLRER